MSLYPSLPNCQPSYPSGRYVKTDPLRREFGLRLLSEPLPEPLRTALIRAWRRPARYDGKQAIQSAGARASTASENAEAQPRQAPAAVGAHRQRPPEEALALFPPTLLGTLSLTELEVSRRVVETPRASISRDTRNKLLKAQGAYLRSLYAALVFRLGEAAALSEFERLLLKVV